VKEQKLTFWQMTSWRARIAFFLFAPMHIALTELVMRHVMTGRDGGFRIATILVCFFTGSAILAVSARSDRIRAAPLLCIFFLEAAFVVILARH
jgi:hypothetical protein